MPEQARPAHADEREANRAEHEAIMARIDGFLELSHAEFAANRAEHEALREEFAANRAEHEALREELAANRKEHEANRKEHEVNRGEHAELREMMAKLGVEMTKLGVEFEQHRNDTKALADGILGLVRKTTALEGADAALDCRVTNLEVRVASLVPKGQGRKKVGPA